MHDFIIVAQKFVQQSNGIRSLHNIAHTINKMGGKARMAFIDPDHTFSQTVSVRDVSWTNPEWDTPPLQESERHLIETSYVLYPEIILGNPLGAKKIIRWFGNRDGVLTGKKVDVTPDDFIVAHSRVTHKNPHCVLYYSHINPVFTMEGTQPTMQRTLDVTYIGKGEYYGKFALIPQTLLVERLWPRWQEQLAIILRNTRIFYTWDAWTQTNVDAILCGAIPFFLRYEPWPEEAIDDTEIGRLPRADAQHQDIDILKFEAERAALIEKISSLAASWDDRVHNFMGMVEQHFIARGLT